MSSAQKSILSENDAMSRHLFFSFRPGTDINKILFELSSAVNTDDTIIGFGESLTRYLNVEIPGLKTMPAQSQAGISIPSTPFALWCGLRGSDRGELFHRSSQIENLLAEAFLLEDVVDCFAYDKNRDLSGYEDGTENPTGDDAVNAAIVQDNETINGSSFVAIQTWVHDFDTLNNMSIVQKDNTFGRHQDSNEEFDAPDNAHVKRAAQEDFEPEAFIVRRSMPWANGMDAGLLFIAFGKSFNAYEAILNRMTGAEDGIADALFQFTQPVTGAYFWCPPANGNKLDLSLLG